MILSDLITDAYRAYRGKSSNAPQAASAKYNDILAIVNRKQREWVNDPNVDWPSRFELRDAGTLTTGTQTYDLDDDIIRLSDYVMLTSLTGVISYVTVVRPQIRSQYSSGCYLSGVDPKQLTFITTIDASNTGYSITVPCFTMPDDLSKPSDTVLVDNPQWLIYAVAAELARNDYSKEEQYPNLNGIANSLYQQMVDAANANSYLQPNGVYNNMPQVNSMISTSGYGSIQ